MTLLQIGGKMNERIEKLLEQCLIETYGVNGELLKFGFDAEKFADLIVAECLVVINQSNGVGDDDVIKISQDVKRHFGVEK